MLDITAVAEPYVRETAAVRELAVARALLRFITRILRVTGTGDGRGDEGRMVDRRLGGRRGGEEAWGVWGAGVRAGRAW